MIIGIAGKKQSGKTTAAQMLCDLVPHATVDSFAEPIKECLAALFGLWYTQTDGDEKELPLVNGERTYAYRIGIHQMRPWALRFSRAAHRSPSEIEDALVAWTTSLEQFYLDGGQITPRYLMQTFGTEMGRTLNPDIWVNDLANRVKPKSWADGCGELLIIPDTRFPNEATWIHNMGGEIWMMRRDVGEADGHASEAAIDSLEWDREIMNHNSLESLRKLVGTAYESRQPRLPL